MLIYYFKYMNSIFLTYKYSETHIQYHHIRSTTVKLNNLNNTKNRFYSKCLNIEKMFNYAS